MAGRSAMLAPFAQRSFRFQWPADLCTAWALEMEALILGWYVLVESGSVGTLALFGALMYVGTLLSPVLGTLGDRIGLGRLLTAMRLAYGLNAAALLVLAAAGALSPQLVLVLAFGIGLLKPSDIGMRSALVASTMPPAALVAAMSISRTTQDSARIAGALAGTGTMAAFGMVPAYGAIVAIYALGALLTWRLRDAGRQGGSRLAAGAQAAAIPSGQPPGTAARSAWGDLVEGLRYIWRTPQLRAAMLVAALANLCAFPLTGGLMPYVAREVFHLDQQGLGWLVAAWATGALGGSLTVSRFGHRLPPGRTMLLAGAAWFVWLLGLALPVGMDLAMLLLAAAGAAQSISMLSLAVLLMRGSDERFRGRIMGARMLAIYTLPIGLLAAGAAIPLIGFAALVVAYCALGLALLLAIALRWRGVLWSAAAAGNRA